MKIKILLASATIIVFIGFLLGETSTGCFRPGLAGGLYIGNSTPSVNHCKPELLYKAIFLYYPTIALAIAAGYYAYVYEGNRKRSYIVFMLGALALFSFLVLLIYLSARATFS